MGRGNLGRKRKSGKRIKGDRLSRPACLRYDRGTERAQAMSALYGTNGTDAIGRAFEAGLLGDGNEAKMLLDTARKIFNLYWRAYETGKFHCPLSDRSGGSVVVLDHERIRRQEEWLGECRNMVRRMGEDVRKAFDQLVISPHPDSGPDWLDRLCWSAQHRMEPDKRDTSNLRAALDALEQL